MTSSLLTMIDDVIHPLGTCVRETVSGVRFGCGWRSERSAAIRRSACSHLHRRGSRRRKKKRKEYKKKEKEKKKEGAR